MRIVVTSNGTDLDAPTSPVFGRCPTYIFVDTETMAFEAVSNPAMSAAGGAGIQAAQFVVEQGAEAVLTGNVGPNAYNVFQAAGVPVYLVTGGTVGEAVEAHKAGRLQSTADASVQAHAGMGMGRGRGMGRGMGRGIGMGRGAPRTTPAPQPAPPASDQEEVAALKQAASDLRQQLAQIVDRLDKLEKES
jgi:predicted Fe-Mo cluster-binding NifX family protein